MLRTALLTLAMGLTLSCSGDDESAKGSYGEQCGGADCAEGLTCQRFPSGNGVCTGMCTSTADCRAAFTPQSVCSGGRCYEPCTDNSHCPSGFQCNNLAGTTQMICQP
jgi:hypothetical protein